MASRIADRDKDRHIAATGLREGLLGPGPPVHRVSRVLEKIGARFRGEPVGAGHRVTLASDHLIFGPPYLWAALSLAGSATSPGAAREHANSHGAPAHDRHRWVGLIAGDVSYLALGVA
jgi:hypothetical protein